MRKYIYLILLPFLIYQCVKSENLPLKEITLCDILTDIHVAEGAVDNESAEMKDSITRLYYPQIFDKHGIKQWQFDSAMSMMSVNPLLMERVFKKVIENIKKKSTTDSLAQKK